MRFPNGFLWGVSTAAYQIEGAAAEDGRGASIWDHFSHAPGRVLHGDTGDIACNHYHRLDEDLDLLATLGAQVYRFSIAWPRIQPTGRGGANPRGIAFYDRLIDGLLKRGLEPVPTLYHWDLPAELQSQGGWAKREIADRFADYADIAFKAFGDRIKMWTTINEPWVAAYFGHRIGIHAPGLRDPAVAAAAHHHLLLAHGAAVDCYRSMGSRGAIGIALNLMQVYATSEHEEDIVAAKLADAQLNMSFLQPLFVGGYPKELCNIEKFWQEDAGIVQRGDFQRMVGRADFLSINSYHPRYVCAPSRVAQARAAGFDGWHDSPMCFGLPMADMKPGGVRKTLMDWPIEASTLCDLLVRVSHLVGELPLYISENGASYADYVDQRGEVRDEERIAYLSEHIAACLVAIERGVDLRGYWLWSFLDNFEWSCGYSQRFGIVHVDFATQKRTPKSSFHWYRELVRSHVLS